MVKFKISIDGRIAGIDERFKHGVYETDDHKEIAILRTMKLALVSEIKEPELPIIPIPSVDKNEVNKIGKHHNTTR